MCGGSHSECVTRRSATLSAPPYRGNRPSAAYLGRIPQDPHCAGPYCVGMNDRVQELPSSAKENLEILSNFIDGEEAKITPMQAGIERISAFFGSTAYFVFAIVFIAGWVALNTWGFHNGWRHVDAPPFPWLQGLVSSNALLLTVAVLIRQNRMSQVGEHRAHLDLQINLLTEQKATKILKIVDELRRTTATRARPDAEVAEMTKPADAHALMHAIKQKHGER